MATSRAEDDISCLTAETCNSKRMSMGITGGFYTSDEYQTKGCYYKNDKVFFSPGTEEEMSTSDLPGLRVRIWCDAGDAAESKVGETTNEVAEMSNDAKIKASASNDGLGLKGFVDIEQNSMSLTQRSVSSGVAITGASFNFIIAASLVGLTNFFVY
jgi:hypothetical protein